MIRANSTPATRAAEKLVTARAPRTLTCANKSRSGVTCQLKLSHRGSHFHRWANGESVTWMGKKAGRE